MSKIFLDTNVLLYTLDQNDEKRQEQAQARMILQRVTEDDNPVISTQVMQGFYVAGASQLGADPLLAKSIIHSFENM